MNVFQYFQSFFSLTSGQVIEGLTVALVCGFFVSLLYRWTCRKPDYSITFVNALPALSMITAIVVIVIGNNLARAFGLVGALSLIRFRTSIKNVQDIVFVFFSLAVGMAAGVRFYSAAIIGTIFIGVSIWVISRINGAYAKKWQA